MASCAGRDRLRPGTQSQGVLFHCWQWFLKLKILNPLTRQESEEAPEGLGKGQALHVIHHSGQPPQAVGQPVTDQSQAPRGLCPRGPAWTSSLLGAPGSTTIFGCFLGYRVLNVLQMESRAVLVVGHWPRASPGPCPAPRPPGRRGPQLG